MERNRVLDIAKGLLISMVIFGHLKQSAHFCHTNLGRMEDVVSLYYSFYMAAFFIISGYCYNTDKPFWTKAKTNFCRILFPVFSLSILSRIIFSIYFGNINQLKEVFTFDYWVNFNDYWFLNALFFSKIAYDTAIVFLRKKWLVLVSAIPLSMFGCYAGTHYGVVIFQHWFPIPNYWCLRASMVAFLFVVVGIMLRDVSKEKITKLLFYGSFVYVALLSFCIISRNDIPEYTKGIIIDNWGLFIAMALSGTCLILLISKLIKKNKVIENCGKVSLVMYGIQMAILKITFDILVTIYGRELTTISSILIALVTFAIAMPIIYFTSEIITNKFPFLIGKFSLANKNEK